MKRLQYAPTEDAWQAVIRLESEDDKPWDEDFKLALALAFDDFAEAVLRRHYETRPRQHPSLPAAGG